jgi:hypothetical protein
MNAERRMQNEEVRNRVFLLLFCIPRSAFKKKGGKIAALSNQIDRA